MNTLADGIGVPKTQEDVLVDMLNSIRSIPLHWTPRVGTRVEDAHILWSAYTQRLQELKLIPAEYGK